MLRAPLLLSSLLLLPLLTSIVSADSTAASFSLSTPSSPPSPATSSPPTSSGAFPTSFSSTSSSPPSPFDSSTSSSFLLPPSHSSSSGLQGYLWAKIVGGVFSLIAILISSLHIRAHLTHNHDSQLRRYVVRILWMVPLYATVGWMGLTMRRYTLYFDVARDVYESVVIWSFFQFCLVYLGGSVVLNEQLGRREQVTHTWPFSLCLRPWSMEQRFLFHTRLGVTQYVVCKSLLAVLTFSLAAADEYADGSWQWGSPYPYITVLNNFSQGYALYALLLFYHATKLDLERIRPVAKFLCVKLIIFATYWQSVAISVLALAGRFEGWEGWTSENVGQGLQDFLICAEMMVASFGHIYAFPSKEFWTQDGGDEETRHGSAMSKVFDVMTPSDIVSDVRELTRMNKKYQQVHNDTEEEWPEQLEQHDPDDMDALQPSSAAAAAADYNGEPQLQLNGVGGKRKKKGKRRGEAANGDRDGQFTTPDEAHRSYSLDGIEERVRKVKAELLEQNRQRVEASRHTRASYGEQQGKGVVDDGGVDSAVELHVFEEGEDEEGGEEQKALSASPSVEDGSSPTVDLERGEDDDDDVHERR